MKSIKYDGLDENELGQKIDWFSGNPIRKTDNSAKGDDFYPKDQVDKPLFLDPSGTPYSLLQELGRPIRANGEACHDNS